MSKIFILIIILATTFFVLPEIKAQTTEIDSLENLLQKHLSKDTVRVNLLNELSNQLLSARNEKVFLYANEAKTISQNIGFEKGTVISLRAIGLYYYYESDFDKSNEYLQKALLKAREIDDKRAMAKNLKSIAGIYIHRAYYLKAVQYLTEALEISEEIQDELIIAECYTNMGIIYHEQGDYTKALKYYTKALNINKQNNSTKRTARNYMQIGSAFLLLKDYGQALNNYKIALNKCIEIDYTSGVVSCLSNTAIVYSDQGNLDKSLEYSYKALKIGKEKGYKHSINVLYINMANTYLKKKNYTKALYYTERSLKIANELNLLDYKKETYLTNSNIFSAIKDYENAYKNHVLFTALNDSIFSIQKVRKIKGLELQYKYEKDKLFVELEQQKKDAVYETELQLQKATKHALIFISVLITFIALIIIYNLLRKRKVNRILTEQKNEIQIKNEKISEQNKILNKKNIAITSSHAKVKESEEKFRRFFDNNKAVMLQLNAKTKRIVGANNAAIQFYGYKREVLLEKTIDDLNTLPTEEINKLLQKAVNTKSNFFEFKHKLANNKIKNVEVYASPIKLHDEILMFAIVHDITDRKQAEKKLENSEKRLRLSQQAGRIGAWEWDLKNDKIYWSDITYRIFGVQKTSNAIENDQYLKYVHPDDRQRLVNIFEAFIKDKKKNLSVEYKIIKNNEIHWINETSELIYDKKGEAIKMIGVIQDITEQKEAELALFKKNAALTNTLNQLKETRIQLIQAEKMASIGVLTAGIAHEINNPVNFIQGGVNSLVRDFKDIEVVFNEVAKIGLETGNETEKLQYLKKLTVEYNLYESLESIPEILKDIKLGAERTTAIVKSLGSFARTDDDFCLVNIHESIENSLILLKNKFKDNIEIIKHFGDGIPEISCSPNKTNQIFMNLLSNAIDAISEKGKIYITTKLLADKVSISIKDTGVGISKELQSKIFDPFYTSKSEGKGMGLGLYIVYGFIHDHKGSIDMISEPGEGSEFIVTLPLV